MRPLAYTLGLGFAIYALLASFYFYQLPRAQYLFAILYLPEVSIRLTPTLAGNYVLTTNWKTKSAPYRLANNIAKHHGWRFEQGRMPDGSGWVFKRIS